MSGTMPDSVFFTSPLPGMFGFESRANAPHASYGFSLAGAGKPSEPHDYYGHDESRWVNLAPDARVLTGLLDGLGALWVHAG